MEDYKKKYELGSIVTATRTFNRETITGEFGGFHLLDKSNPKSIVGVVHTTNGSYDVEPNSIESVISEDERIRKELISAFTVTADKRGREIYGNGITYGQVLAWLEKQGHDGKKWIYEDAYIKEKEQVFQDGIDEVLENPQRYGLEKQGEQNPVPITDEWIKKYWKHHKVTNPNSYDKGDEIQFDHDGFVRFCNKYFQKPAWYEWDENGFSDSLWAIQQARTITKDENDMGNLWYAEKWLKSLKERMKGE